MAGVRGVGSANSLYENILRTSKEEREWFTASDYTGRLARVLIAYYWLMVRYPLSFLYFLVRYNMTWEGNACGLIVTLCFYPVYPLAALGLLLIKKAILPARAYEKGNIFFMGPNSLILDAMWNVYKALSPPVCQFMLNRGDSTAIAHSWWDHITTKYFWRAHLERTGVRVPQELGRWVEKEPGIWGVEWKVKLVDQDIVIKVKDESNGCGDAFLLFGDGPGMINSAEALDEFLHKNHVGLEALVLEWVRPAEGQEVHSLDIVTLAKPDGEIELLTVVYWGDCREPTTTHTTQGGYVVDAAKEEIAATCKWYAPGFANMTPKIQYSIGHKLPGVAECCAKMMECHRAVMTEQPWIRMIGWDAIIAKGGPPVFFEGNYAQMRLPRRVFLTWENLWHCLRVYG